MIYLLVSLFFSQDLGFGQTEKKKKKRVQSFFLTFCLIPTRKKKKKTKEEREKPRGVFNCMLYEREKSTYAFFRNKDFVWGREGGSFCMKTPFLNCRFLLS